MVTNFLNAVKAECDLARNQDQPLLVMLFGHGDSTSKGVQLGLEVVQGKTTLPLLEMDAFREAVGGNVQVTVLSTACFSGGWAINPQLNTTILAAAGPSPSSGSSKYITGESEAWAASSTMGRYCGSIYATAVIDTLAQENAPHIENLKEGQVMPEEERSATYSTFANTIYQVLFTRVDKWAAVHDIRFSAQDDAWDMEWKQRTGLPLAQYRSRWDSLPEAAADPAASSSRDPSYNDPSEDLGQVPRGATGSARIGACSINGRSNGNLAVMRSMVRLPAFAPN